MGEKNCEVFLVSEGPRKIEVIKVIRAYTDVGLKEAKELAESTPATVWSGVAEDVAGNMKRDLENAGATAEVRPASGVGVIDHKPDDGPECSVTIYDQGPEKIEVIKIVRQYTNLGLKEAKDLVESAPGAVCSGLTGVAAEAMKRAIEASGGLAEITGGSGFGWTAEGSDREPKYEVFLSDLGSEKIEVIKVVRQYTNLGLKEAKELVESAPVAVCSGLSREAAENMWQGLVHVGATAQVRNTGSKGKETGSNRSS